MAVSRPWQATPSVSRFDRLSESPSTRGMAWWALSMNVPPQFTQAPSSLTMAGASCRHARVVYGLLLLRVLVQIRQRDPFVVSAQGPRSPRPSTDGRRSHLQWQCPAPRARAARLGATQPRWPLVRVRPALLHRLGPELRGAACATRSPSSPRSTSTRSHEGSRKLCMRRRGRGSPASPTAGVAS